MNEKKPDDFWSIGGKVFVVLFWLFILLGVMPWVVGLGCFALLCGGGSH